jgi:2-polyprenyl-6-methoxyphenol hydroxylase-like FAD-dependent oxidoreductase
MTEIVNSDYQVVVAGGGPCGLMLAIELGRRNISTLVLNERATTTPFPQANATQARTMEHFRRIGIADAVRKTGLPADYTTDAACFTRLAGHEIARFEMPPSGEAPRLIRTLSGSWSGAELPHRGAQMYFERVLFEKATTFPSVHLRYGWKLTRFDDCGEAVHVVAEKVGACERRVVTGQYLVGCDGARSAVRRQLDIPYEGKAGVVREFMGGRMLQVHLRAPAIYEIVRNKRRAWQYWAINFEQKGFITAVNGKDEFVFVIQLRPGQDEKDISNEDIHSALAKMVGAKCPIEIISAVPWTAGLVLVAQRFQKGRVFIAGDAAHLFTPSGGLGYNTAVEDAVNLSWKLAATLQGWGGANLLTSYEAEMIPLARRNTRYADHFADTIAMSDLLDIEAETEAGELARSRIGEVWNRRTREVLNIPGVTFGLRYDESPIVFSDGRKPPVDQANAYVPSAVPGGRPPHAWLADGGSLFDTFGPEFSLLRLSDDCEVESFVSEAKRRNLPLKVVHLEGEHLKDLYEASLALIRPDQIVAWRGDSAQNAESVLKHVLGHECSQNRPLRRRREDLQPAKVSHNVTGNNS